MRTRRLRLLAAVAACGWFWLPTAALHAADDPPPRFAVRSQDAGPLVLVLYGDTRFTQRTDVVNTVARRALVERIAAEKPAAILIGGDLVYDGSNPDDYRTFASETAAWSTQKIPVFPALGNHEFKGCAPHAQVCLENWWTAFGDLALRPHRWYSVAIGSNLLALVLDSDAALKPGSEQRAWFEEQLSGAPEQVKFLLIVLHYPPVRDPFFPRMRDEKEIARYLSRHASTLRAKVLVVGSHVHNYERYTRDGVSYVVSGGGGAKPVPAPRITVESDRMTATMVRYDAAKVAGPEAWTEPDRFELRAKN